MFASNRFYVRVETCLIRVRSAGSSGLPDLETRIAMIAVSKPAAIAEAAKAIMIKVRNSGIGN